MKILRFLLSALVIVFVYTGVYSTTALAIPNISIAANAALLADGDTGEILYEQNIHDRVYPASVTKIMMALVVFEEIDAGHLALTDVITASSDAHQDVTEDGSTQNIKAGEQMTVEDLLYCALVASANEACNITCRVSFRRYCRLCCTDESASCRPGLLRHSLCQYPRAAQRRSLHNSLRYVSYYTRSAEISRIS